MGETQGTIHPRAKFLPSCELVKPSKFVLPKYNGRMSIGYIYPFQKGENREEEMGNKPK